MKSKILLLTLFAVAFGSGCSLELRRDAKKIEASLLKLAPLGSSPETVLDVVQKKGWRTSGHNPSSGYLNQERGYHGLDIVGVAHIRAPLEQRLLDVEALDDRLDDQIAILGLLEVILEVAGRYQDRVARVRERRGLRFLELVERSVGE